MACVLLLSKNPTAPWGTAGVLLKILHEVDLVGDGEGVLKIDFGAAVGDELFDLVDAVADGVFVDVHGGGCFLIIHVEPGEGEKGVEELALIIGVALEDGLGHVVIKLLEGGGVVEGDEDAGDADVFICLLYTSPSPRDTR